MSKANSSQRREFLRRIGSLGAAVLSSTGLAEAKPERLPNPVGYATLSWPESQFGEALKTISSLHYKGIQMIGPVERDYAGKAGELKDELQSLSLKPVALSCWGVSLDPAKEVDSSRRFREYAAFQRDLGGLYLQVTDGASRERLIATSRSSRWACG